MMRHCDAGRVFELNFVANRTAKQQITRNEAGLFSSLLLPGIIEQRRASCRYTLLLLLYWSEICML